MTRKITVERRRDGTFSEEAVEHPAVGIARAADDSGEVEARASVQDATRGAPAAPAKRSRAR